MFYTILTALFTGVALFAAWVSYTAAGQARDASDELKRTRSTLATHTLDLQALEFRVGKLAGRFYRTQRNEPDPPPPEPLVVDKDALRRAHLGTKQ